MALELSPPLTIREILALIDTVAAAGRESLAADDTYAADAALCAIARAVEVATSSLDTPALSASNLVLDNHCENA